MSQISPEQLLLPSVFDRLLGENEGYLEEPGRNQRLRDLKLSVRRDLEWLLNTRVCYCDIPKESEYLKSSILNYGIPDFSGLAMGSRDGKNRLREQVEDAIRRFETRFKSVHVELIEDEEGQQRRTIRFRIEGTLHAEPAPEPVEYDSTLTPTVGQFEVRASEA